MTPTLAGRLQTRVFTIVVIGGLWTLLITPALSGMGTLGDAYATTFTVLAVVGLLGLVWEFPYHFLQQFRWEKDWPTLLGLVTAVNEGIVVWFVVDLGLAPGLAAGSMPLGAFLLHFLTTWLVIFLFVNGPMRVPFVRWRFRGGRLI